MPVWLQVVQKTPSNPPDLPVDRITQADVLAVLSPIWTTRPETARRVRQRVRSVLRYCEAHGFLDRNVAGDAIDGALPAMPKVKEHHAALDYREVPEAMKVIGSRVSAARLCLKWLILTAARSDEARGATWTEGDRILLLEIPGDRMKAAKNTGSPCRVVRDRLGRGRATAGRSHLVFSVCDEKQGQP